MTNARFYVDAPAHVALPYGLNSVVEWREPGNSHWKMGITWQSLCGGGGTTYDPCAAVTGSPPVTAGNPPAKADNIDRVNRGATPFTVFAELDCSTVSFYEESEDQIRQALLQSEPWQLERVFWTGNAGGQVVAFPHLAANAQINDASADSATPIILQQAATVVTGSAVDVVEALGMLERAMGDCLTGTGVIHVTADLLPHLDAWNLVKKVGNRLVTLAGNYVAVGSGYRGTAPDGSTPQVGRSWMYGTGPVFGYKSDVTVFPRSSTVDRSVNTVKAIAERTYLLGYDCCLLAIQTSTGGVSSGTPGTT